MLTNASAALTALAVVVGLSVPFAASAGAATVAPGSTPCAPPSDAATTTAQRAAVSASFTAGWNNLAAVQDGTAVYTGGNNNQVWGTWSPNRPSEQWIQYDWSGEANLTGASVAFWSNNSSDTAGNDVTVAKSWRLQAWTGNTWTDIALRDGAEYPRAKTSLNTVEFAAPVTTTRLRAVFQATTDGSTFAAIGVSDFAVTGSAPLAAGAGSEVLSSSEFNVQINRKNGAVYTLGSAQDGPECTNYVSNPTIRPSFDQDDSRWLGDVTMKVNGVFRTTGNSDDSRAVSRSGNTVSVAYDGSASRANGIQGYGLTQKWDLDGDTLDWSITLDNTKGGQALKVEDLGLPMLMNSWFNGADQTSIYEQNVMRHTFIADDGSYVYWQRPNGQGPFLVMVPDAGTSLEYRDKAKIGENAFSQVDPVWEGLSEFMIHSESRQKDRAGKVVGFLPASSATIPAGGEKTYGFSFRWADDYADLRDVLYDAGVVDVVSLPGMVIPQDTKATLAVRAKDGIESVVGQAGRDIAIEPAGERKGYKLYTLALPKLGENTVTVTYGGGRTSVLQYNSIAPIEELIGDRAEFIVDKQQAKDPARGYDGAYLQWDMSRKSMVTWDNFDSYGGAGYLKRWMVGGSDDVGLSPAAFLSLRNLQVPDQKQISSLDYYLENYIWGYLQSQTDAKGDRTYRVYHWYDGGDGNAPSSGDGQATWRVMNFPHVWNTYLNMYRIAKTYPQVQTKLTSKEYLLRAYNTMKAYFEHPNAGTLDDASREMGSMGESTIPDVVDALRAEGLTAESDVIDGYMKAKAKEMLSRKYPFASEMAIDTTAFESTYAFAKRTGNEPMASRTTYASLAARGMQPLWYFYGPDIRGAESWWNLSYETHLGAWQQQDYLQSYDAAAAGINFDEAMRVTYGAYLAGWSNVNAGQLSSDPANMGAAAWQYQSQGGIGENMWGFMPMVADRWWAWSGEADLGLWGGLRTASVNVVNDPIVGLYGYGGDVSLAGSKYSIVPKDGVRQRFTLYTENKFGVELEGAKYSAATVSEDLSSITLQLDANPATSTNATVLLRNLPANSYKVAVDGRVVRTATQAELAAGITLSDLKSAKHRLTVTAATPDTQAPVTTAAPDPASGSVAEGKTVTVKFAATDDDSGVDYTEYSTDGGTTWIRATASGVSFAALGGHEVRYRSVDKAGNVEPAKSVTVTVTAALPSAKASLTSGDPANVDGWYTQRVLVKLEAPKAGQKIQYRIGSGSWRNYSTPFTVSANGTSTIAHRLLASNVVVEGSEAQTVVKIDATLPTASAVRTPASGTATPRNPLTFAFAAVDTHSGVDKLEYRVNSGAWQAASADPVVFGSVGDYIVSFRASDKAGNVSAIKSSTFTIAPDPVTAIKTSASTVKPGAAITLSLTGFARWSDIVVSIGGAQVGTVLTDQNGAGRVTVRVPAATPNGPTAITATGGEPTLTATSSVTVKK